VGGSESYLRDLVALLRVAHHEVAALTFRRHDEPPLAPRDGEFELPALLRGGDATFMREVEACLDDFEPALVHLHSMGSEEALVADAARIRGIPRVFTYHLPAASCARGDLLQWGERVCDGRVETLRCAACRIQKVTGAPPAVAEAVGAVIARVSPLLGRTLPPAARHKLDYSYSTGLHRDQLLRFLGSCDAIVACAPWVVDVLARNGVEANRVVLMPQGVPLALEAIGARAARTRETVNVGYIGRISEAKGVDLLFRAMRRAKDPRLRLMVAGDEDGSQRGEETGRALAAGEARISFLGLIEHDQLGTFYADLDYLAVPSRGLETGPLVVWEALAQGVPVLASTRIGHPDLVAEGHGLIVEPHSVERWAEVLDAAASQRLDLATTGRRLRSMRDVGAETAALYARLLGS
jgi:glycosyltransferase involved in cell wall biosynthesis